MQGILLVNKLVGWTSFDVVAYVRKIIASEEKIKPAQVKVGHTGTLDPLAEGLLVLLIGKPYTRMAEELTKLDKEYFLQMKLGEITDSFDLETEPRFYSSTLPSHLEVEQALRSFEGHISQKPPAFSALKVNGQRAYKIARRGLEVDLKARPVTISELELINYSYPLLNLRASVSSGTYIRSLVSDVGEKLATGAYMSALKRTKVGDFRLEDALQVKKLTYDLLAEHLYYI